MKFLPYTLNYRCGEEGTKQPQMISFFPPIMGRKRIYYTPEAPVAANRAKSKRYYDKYAFPRTVAKAPRNHEIARAKDEINAKRRPQYKNKVEEIQKVSLYFLSESLTLGFWYVCLGLRGKSSWSHHRNISITNRMMHSWHFKWRT